MKTGTNLQKARNPPLYPHPTGSWFNNPAEYFQKRRFPCTVTANNPDPVSLLDLEGNIVESPKFFIRGFEDQGSRNERDEADVGR